MFNPSLKRKSVFSLMFVALIFQACANAQMISTPTATPTAESTATEIVAQPSATATPTQVRPTETLATSASNLKITLTAIKGNLFIRRGPDMAFNPIGVLYENTKVKVVGRDVLLRWAQIEIPDSQDTGWVSLQTKYSKVDGDIQSLPDFIPTEWPVPAYLRNCTHHQMYIMPGAITLPSSFRAPDNEIWLYPGHYSVFDFDMPDLPEVMKFDIREGQEVEIQDDGTGEHRICP
ncbi:MAG: SH3 domain-containing protein [Anaerolineales bacterium]